MVRKSICKGTGYWQLALNGKTYLLHRLIAEQFVPNADPARFKVIDHLNHDRSDYRISNLRWTTQSANCKNKTSHKGVLYKYVDEIADDCIVIDRYGNRVLENYYYDRDLDQFYWNDIELNRYRELPVITMKNGVRCVYMNDAEGKRVAICMKKFKQLYNLE